MNDTKAYLLAVDGKSFPDHKWDFGFIKEAFDKNNIECIETAKLPKTDRAFVVICGFENQNLIKEINQELTKLNKVVLFITADERGLFRADKINHPNITIWVQSPYPGRHEGFNKMPIGCPSHMKNNLPEYTAKKNDVFFSGQITHERRKQLADAMPNVENALFNPTPGFTKGYAPKEYFSHILESKIVPCPAGTSTIDSFRFYEALEMLALPIGDIRNSSNEKQDYWDFVFEQEVPTPKSANWFSLNTQVKELLSDYPANMHRAVSWWIRYKRDFAYKIMEQLNG